MKNFTKHSVKLMNWKGERVLGTLNVKISTDPDPLDGIIAESRVDISSDWNRIQTRDVYATRGAMHSCIIEHAQPTWILPNTRTSTKKKREVTKNFKALLLACPWLRLTNKGGWRPGPYLYTKVAQNMRLGKLGVVGGGYLFEAPYWATSVNPLLDAAVTRVVSKMLMGLDRPTTGIYSVSPFWFCRNGEYCEVHLASHPVSLTVQAAISPSAHDTVLSSEILLDWFEANFFADEAKALSQLIQPIDFNDPASLDFSVFK